MSTFPKRMHPATALLPSAPAAPAPTYQPISTTRQSFESEATRTGSISTSASLYKEGLERTCTQDKSSSKAKKAWEKFKKMAKEHHNSVNAAYQVYYGAGTYPLEWKPEGKEGAMQVREIGGK